MSEAVSPTRLHDRRLACRMRDDPEFRAEFERQQREIAALDVLVTALDELLDAPG